MTKSLSAFAKHEKMGECKVCLLVPEEARREIATRSEDVLLNTVVKWLEKEHGIKLTVKDITAHARAGHEQWAKEA